MAPRLRPARASPVGGCLVIGARMPLIAYNINLDTDRLDVAKKIAAAHPPQQRRPALRQSRRVQLEDRGARPGIDEPDQLPEDADVPRLRSGQARGRALRRVGARERDRRAGSVGRARLSGRVLSAARALRPNQILENRLRDATATHHCATSIAPSTRRAGAIPNARIFRYRLLRSTPSTSAVREMLPCCAASARRM